MKTRDLIALLLVCLTIVAVILIMARCSVESSGICRATNGTPSGFPGDCIRSPSQ